MKELIRKNILALEPYSTARDEYKGDVGAFLDANENPFREGTNRYPSTSLRNKVIGKIAKMRGIAPEKLFLGNGSDEAIDLCYRIFCNPGIDNAVMIAPSYGMYGVCAEVNDIECRKVQLGPAFELPVEQLLAASDDKSKLLFICSPNNPTANSFPAEQIERLIANFKGMVVVDEAYIDYSESESLAGLVDKYENLIILQTLSKAYGMAALRMGLAISNPEVIRYFNMVRYPYNVGGDTLERADELLPFDVQEQVRETKKWRKIIMEELRHLPYVSKVYPSDANFVLALFDDPKGVYDKLLEGKVIVRDRSNVKGCEGALRITVGTAEENRRMLEILKNFGK